MIGDTTERRIANVSRRCARLVLELQREGEHQAAAKLEQAAVEAIEQMRAESMATKGRR